MTLSLNWNLIFSAFLALAVHAAVVALILIRWEETPTVELTDVQPYYLEASLVAENPYEARKRKAAALAEQKKRQRHQNAIEKASQVVKKPVASVAETPVPRKTTESESITYSRNADLEKMLDQARTDLSEQRETELNRQEFEASLASAVLQEQAARRAITDDEKAMAYVSQIQREIIQNWSRPPSARNGMQAILRVFLVPTGEVVNVVVEEGSGNDSFDRSAMLAVQKAERFQVPVDYGQFERNFREFTVVFRPEDLRL